MSAPDSSAEPFVLKLADCRDAEVVGGKAINLARLINAGFPVPGGFAVTTHAFRVAAGVPEVPDIVREAVLAAYRRMGSPVVAVRSSATAEDLAEASMAGQYETFLDVEGEEELIEAVAKCWASLDSARSRAYLAEHGIERAGVAMGVVVQRQVAAEAAGVMFTANPKPGALGRDAHRVELGTRRGGGVGDRATRHTGAGSRHRGGEVDHGRQQGGLDPGRFARPRGGARRAARATLVELAAGLRLVADGTRGDGALRGGAGC